MPVVKMPDGTQVRFPDDMPREQIRDMIASKFPDAVPRAESQQSIDLRGELSAMTQNPAKAQYDALPGWQKPIVAASDIAQLTADGATFGFGDKAVAAVRSPFTGKSYEEELAAQRGLTQGARNRAGSAGIAAEVTGNLALPVKAGATLTGRLGTSAMTGAKGLGARTGLMAAEGAGYGAASAAGHDQDIGTGAAIGLVGGAGGNLLGEGISAGVGKVAGMFNKPVPVPSVDDLKAAGSAAFQRADKAGVIFNKQAVSQLNRNIVDDLKELAFHPSNEPGAMAALNTLRRMQDGNVTMKGLHAVRRMAQNGFIPGNNSNNAAIGKIIDRIDEMIDAADPNTVLAATSNPKAAAEAFKEAKKQWHTAKKLETVEKHARKGGLMANSNILADEVGATKKQLRSLLLNDAKSRGFSTAEKKQLERAAGYTGSQRVLHAVSGLMPRDKLSTAVHMAAGGPAAFASGGASLPVQAGLMGVGYAAQKANEALAKKSVVELTRLIANGGIPPAQVQNLMQRLAHSKREALSRTLMALGVYSGREAVAQQ